MLVDNHFSDCVLDFSNFSEAKSKNNRFTACRLQESYWQEVTIEKGTVFENSELGAMDFIGTNLKGVDLSSSNLSELRIDSKKMSGLIISPAQASYLIQLFGVKIKD